MKNIITVLDDSVETTDFQAFKKLVNSDNDEDFTFESIGLEYHYRQQHRQLYTFKIIDKKKLILSRIKYGF